ncbi:hypothetical protein DSECCO2_508840 [anaerobic digester metagenome]
MVDGLVAALDQSPENRYLGWGRLKAADDHQLAEVSALRGPFFSSINQDVPHTDEVHQTFFRKRLFIERQEERDIDPDYLVRPEARQVGLEIPQRSDQRQKVVQDPLGYGAVPDQRGEIHGILDEDRTDNVAERMAAHRPQLLLVLVDEVRDQIVQVRDAEGGNGHPFQKLGPHVHGQSWTRNQQPDLERRRLEIIQETGYRRTVQSAGCPAYELNLSHGRDLSPRFK